MRLLFLLLALLVGAGRAAAQPEGVLQIDDDLHRFLLEQQAAGRLPGVILSHQPLSGRETARHLDSLSLRADLSVRDLRQLDRFRGVAPVAAGTSRGWRSRIYRNGQDLLTFEGDGYMVHVNPTLHTAYGYPVRSGQSDSTGAAAWHYVRGARISGHLGPHLFFESRLAEVRERPVWPTQSDGTAPRQGFVALLDSVNDAYTAEGHIGLRARFLELRFGRDRNQWGPGLGSVVLSDYAPAYEQLQLRASVGRVQYAMMLGGFTERRLRPAGADVALPRKYGAFHRLALALPGRVEVGLFESVIFAPDTLGIRRGFDLSYANPVIFYRAVERDRGSPDNVLLGADAAWVAVPGVRIYGQLLLDELKVEEIGRGWWGNKWAWLAGIHTTSLPIEGLSFTAELARLRPYLYSHRWAGNDYVHYDDVLGHPAGPNAEDLSLSLVYQPAGRWGGGLHASTTRRGRNDGSRNYGGDPRLPYTTRVAETGVHLLQGIRQHRHLVEAYGGYQLLPTLHLEAALRVQVIDDAEIGLRRYVLPMLQLRWGMPFRSVRF